jgi:predicted ATP-dependent endonuclease of OLD family
MQKDSDIHLVFIEEPELNLHPGFQRLFIESLKNINNIIVFFTTHSNHFLDMTFENNEDINVFSFDKNVIKSSHSSKSIKPSFNVTNLSNPDFNLLANLGVKNSSVFLTNCTIWIEGISDRIYVKKYIETYQKHKGLKEFQEDIHYSFVEYGGNNIVHWSFLSSKYENTISVERLCGKLFLISDSDNVNLNNLKEGKPESEKESRIIELQKNLNKNFYLLNVREIENLLTPEILKKTILEYAKDEDSESYIKDFSIDDYKNEKLGKFISEILIQNKSKFKAVSNKYGNIIDKQKFALSACSYIFNTNDLSGEATEIGKSLYEFIKSNNS